MANQSTDNTDINLLLTLAFVACISGQTLARVAVRAESILIIFCSARAAIFARMAVARIGPRWKQTIKVNISQWSSYTCMNLASRFLINLTETCFRS